MLLNEPLCVIQLLQCWCVGRTGCWVGTSLWHSDMLWHSWTSSLPVFGRSACLFSKRGLKVEREEAKKELTLTFLTAQPYIWVRHFTIGVQVPVCSEGRALILKVTLFNHQHKKLLCSTGSCLTLCFCLFFFFLVCEIFATIQVDIPLSD